MTHYTDKLIPLILELIEEGLSLSKIAKMYDVSITFVQKIRDNYDWYYLNYGDISSKI